MFRPKYQLFAATLVARRAARRPRSVLIVAAPHAATGYDPKLLTIVSFEPGFYDLYVCFIYKSLLNVILRFRSQYGMLRLECEMLSF